MNAKSLMCKLYKYSEYRDLLDNNFNLYNSFTLYELDDTDDRVIDYPAVALFIYNKYFNDIFNESIIHDLTKISTEFLAIIISRRNQHHTLFMEFIYKSIVSKQWQAKN